MQIYVYGQQLLYLYAYQRNGITCLTQSTGGYFGPSYGENPRLNRGQIDYEKKIEHKKYVSFIDWLKYQDYQPGYDSIDLYEAEMKEILGNTP